MEGTAREQARETEIGDEGFSNGKKQRAGTSIIQTLSKCLSNPDHLCDGGELELGTGFSQVTR